MMPSSQGAMAQMTLLGPQGVTARILVEAINAEVAPLTAHRHRCHRTAQLPHHQ